jgi:hypothetical protein
MKTLGADRPQLVAPARGEDGDEDAEEARRNHGEHAVLALAQDHRSAASASFDGDDVQTNVAAVMVGAMAGLSGPPAVEIGEIAASAVVGVVVSASGACRALIPQSVTASRPCGLLALGAGDAVDSDCVGRDRLGVCCLCDGPVSAKLGSWC